MVSWQDLFAALGLVLVIEGALALTAPGLVKAAARFYQQASSRALRTAGLVLVVIGLGVVALARGVF